jgi:PAS domain S-box-containing protein
MINQKLDKLGNFHFETKKREKSISAKTYESVNFRSDGSRFPVEINQQFIDIDDITYYQAVARDITERKEAEEKLKKSEENFRKLVETINDAIYEISMDGTINYISPAIERIVGYKPEELIGKNFFTYMYPDDHQDLFVALQQLGTKDYFYLEYRYLDKAGNIRWVRSSTNPIYENGKIIGGRGSLTDIHDRKLAEQLVKKSEEKYKTLFFDSPDAYLIIQDGKFIECNKASEVLIGADQKYIIGKTPDMISPEYQPNGKKSIEYATELIKETFEKGSNSFEWEHKRANGTLFLAQINLATIAYENKASIFVCWRDITLQKLAEENIRKLSIAVEQSPVSIIITNPEAMSFS